MKTSYKENPLQPKISQKQSVIFGKVTKKMNNMSNPETKVVPPHLES